MDTPKMWQESACYHTSLSYWKCFFNILSGKYVTRDIYYIQHFFCLNKNDILIAKAVS